MKIVIVDGSPRKGNTLAAINAFVEGVGSDHEVEIIDANKLDIKPCQGCGACECYKGCVWKDDTNPTIDKLVDADFILFATPVYWWGVTAQLKIVIDKCYCRGAQLKNKKIGLLMVGGSPVGSTQYELITKQFECMAGFLDWDIAFAKSYYATERNDLQNRPDELAAMTEYGKMFV